MPLQPSFQIRADPSLENVTFSWSRQGRDGGSGKGGVGVVEDKWRKGGQRGDCRFSDAEDGRIEGESGRKEAVAEEGERDGREGFFSVL